MSSASVEVMPSIEDGAPKDKDEKKKTKKYILKALTSQQKESVDLEEVAPPEKSMRGWSSI